MLLCLASLPSLPHTHLGVQPASGNQVDVGAHQRQQAALQGCCGGGAVRPHKEALQWRTAGKGVR